MMAGFKADLSPKQAWDILKSEAASILIDVRTKSEWLYVGVPELSSIGKQTILKEWRFDSDKSINPNFAAELSLLVTDKEIPLLFLCRTGGRSAEAATIMTDHGFSNCYNIANGFEGDLDDDSHRGNKNGWKASNLPWRQS